MPAAELFLAIRQAAEKARLQAVGVAVQDLHTNWAFAHDEQRWFHAASTFKVGILLALLKAAADERVHLQDQLHVRNRFHSIVRDAPPFRVHSTRDGDPVVYGQVGRSMSLEALAHAMITRSSNLATNLLMDYLTIKTVRETMQQAKVSDVNILRGVEDLAAHEQGIDNEATAMGLLQLMRHFTEASSFLPESQRQIGVRILLQQEFNRMIPAKLPPGTKVAHKTGEISTNSHDIAIVFPKDRRPYIVTILTQSLPDDSGRSAAVAEIAAAVHKAVLAAAPQPEPALPRMIDSLPIVDGLQLPEQWRALLRPAQAVQDGAGHTHRLPRYFYQVDTWEAARGVKLTAHFTLAELMVVDCREARLLLHQFPHYVPCAISVLARYLEEFRARVEGAVQVSVNGGYRSPAHGHPGPLGPHAWATAADIYRINGEAVDDERSIERFGKIAASIGQEVRVLPYGHQPGTTDDHLHLDIGYLTLAPYGCDEA